MRLWIILLQCHSRWPWSIFYSWCLPIPGYPRPFLWLWYMMPWDLPASSPKFQRIFYLILYLSESRSYYFHTENYVSASEPITLQILESHYHSLTSVPYHLLLWHFPKQTSRMDHSQTRRLSLQSQRISGLSIWISKQVSVTKLSEIIARVLKFFLQQSKVTIIITRELTVMPKTLLFDKSSEMDPRTSWNESSRDSKDDGFLISNQIQNISSIFR